MSKAQELVEQIRVANAEAAKAYATLESKRRAAVSNNIDPRDSANEAIRTQLVDAAMAYDQAVTEVEALRFDLAQLPGHEASGISDRDRLAALSGASEEGQRAAASAGAAFAEMAGAMNAAAMPSGGIKIPSLLASHLSHPIGGGYQAAIEGTGGGGKMNPYLPVQGLSLIPHRRLSVLDLIPNTPVSGLGGEKIQYMKQTVYTPGATTVAALAEKPVSVVTLSRETTELYTVATISEQIPNQILALPLDLQAFVENEMSQAVREACETYSISGDGTGEPSGILTESIGSQARSGDDPVTAIRKAITILENLNIAPDAIVLNPSDFQDIDIETDGQGRYLYSDPGGSGGSGRVWRLPIVSTPAITAGTGLVGNFAIGSRRWTGESRIEWGRMSDDLKYNALRMVAETGFAFAVTRPSAFVKVTGL